MQQHAPEIKAQVIAEWQTGATPGALSRKYSIPRPTIIGWTKAYTRQVVIQEPDLREQFGRLVYQTTLHTFEALDAHVSALRDPALAGVVEGWTTRVAELTKTAIALGTAIQQGSPEPIPIESGSDSAAGASAGDEKRIEGVAG